MLCAHAHRSQQKQPQAGTPTGTNGTGDIGAGAAVFDDTAPAAGFYRVTVYPVRQD